MKLIHLSDLHLGKRVNEFSMLEEQRYILREILRIIDEEKPSGVLVAGDIYDKSVPPVEAVELLGDFLNQLAKRELFVFMISGNHDSPERLAFASSLIARSGIYISPVYDGNVAPVTLSDAYGAVHIYLLPFIKPVHVRGAYPEEKVESYTDAVRTAIEHMEINPEERNILVTHQFVTGAQTCDSEELSVGGTDNVDVSVFDSFDYVALGHIHGPQWIGRDTVRYCGTPLKYSFSEAKHHKSVTVLELGEKGRTELYTVPLSPLHDMREIRGSYEELMTKENYEGAAVNDYLHITLTDEEDVLDAAAKLRVVYPNLMKIDYDNKRTRDNRELTEIEEIQKKQPIQLVQEFFELRNNQPMNEKQTELVSALIEEIWRE